MPRWPTRLSTHSAEVSLAGLASNRLWQSQTQEVQAPNESVDGNLRAAVDLAAHDLRALQLAQRTRQNLGETAAPHKLVGAVLPSQPHGHITRAALPIKLKRDRLQAAEVHRNGEGARDE
ncbi:unnamed protein product [Prorocentrum cordatum]|uniref:Ribosome biogenesis regulatory protein n=1 Tax=Prorocentrum cordatum TaxID=2364126 RepID=A0ABN9PK46_9DINO|nr:unnamed protein product [Polarella glacialis]